MSRRSPVYTGAVIIDSNELDIASSSSSRGAVIISDDEEQHPVAVNEVELSYTDAMGIVQAHSHDVNAHGDMPIVTGEIAHNTRTKVRILRATRARNADEVIVKRFDVGKLVNGTSVVARQTRKNIAKFKRECDIMKHIGAHPNVLQVLACYFTMLQPQRDISFNIILPVMAGSLDALMNDIALYRNTNKYKFIEVNESVSQQNAKHFLMSFTAQLISGMMYIHSKNVIHCDLKPDNIMCTYVNGQLDVRIGDFGMSSVPTGGTVTIEDNFPHTHMSILGNIAYSPPEVIWRRFIGLAYETSYTNGSALSAVSPQELVTDYLPLVTKFNRFTYTPAVDIWAIGVLLMWVHDFCVNIVYSQFVTDNSGRRHYDPPELYVAPTVPYTTNNLLPYMRATFEQMLMTWERGKLMPPIPYYTDVYAACEKFNTVDSRNFLIIVVLLRTERRRIANITRTPHILGNDLTRFLELVKTTQAIDPRLRPLRLNFVYQPNVQDIDDDN